MIIEILKEKYILVFLFLFFFSSAGFAQQDSLQIETEEDSVVYVYEEPLIIQQSVIQKEVVFNQWFFEISGSAFKYNDFHNLCDQFADYKVEIQKSTHPVLSSSVGANIIYKSKKRSLMYSLGVSYTTFQESFSHQQDSTKIFNYANRYNYLDINGNVGVWLLRKHKFLSIILNTGVSMSTLVKNDGYTIDYFVFNTVESNATAGRDAGWVGNAKVGAKAIFFNNKRIKLFLQPFVRTNFTSVLLYGNNYYQRRLAYGLELGLIYGL